MGILVAVFWGLGCLVIGIGGIMLLVAAFRESAGWGLAVLLLPFASLIFLIVHWTEAKKAFATQLCGLSFCAVAFSLAVTTAASGIQETLRQAATLPVSGKMSAHLPESMQEFAEGAGEFEYEEEEPIVNRSVSFIGRTLSEVRRELGAPRAMVEANGETVYYYPGLELTAADGETVTGQGYPAPRKRPRGRGGRRETR